MHPPRARPTRRINGIAHMPAKDRLREADRGSVGAGIGNIVKIGTCRVADCLGVAAALHGMVNEFHRLAKRRLLKMRALI
ncbi:hypothetical protein Sa4125_31410 [Aureimonas sp. SA4125]|nr:hypothetical protein Sa4125_31410 [Aureimonas sp. SA4125]